MKEKTSFKDKLIRAFFSGVLVIVPAALTIYLLYAAVKYVDELLYLNVPGLGLLTILVFVTLVGFLSSSILMNPFIFIFEIVSDKVPFIRLIYNSIKDMVEAFVGEKKSFNHPVLLTINKEASIKRLGFITTKDLSFLGVEGNNVGVYVPHSYAFSGNFYIVPQEQVEKLEYSSSEVMKLIVSGGVAKAESNDKKDSNKKKKNEKAENIESNE